MRDAVWCGNKAGQPILHIVAQSEIERELAGFWPLSRTGSMPLCVDRTVVEVSATGCRVAPDLSGDRAGRSPKLPGDGTDTYAPRALQSYFLTFCEGKATVLQ